MEQALSKLVRIHGTQAVVSALAGAALDLSIEAGNDGNKLLADWLRYDHNALAQLATYCTSDCSALHKRARALGAG